MYKNSVIYHPIKFFYYVTLLRKKNLTKPYMDIISQLEQRQPPWQLSVYFSF